MYFLRSPGGRAELFAQTTGSVQQVINLANLKNIRIPLPDLPTQRKIAGILSAYDDLIENNLRRIKILEEMAQSLYREWFVHFRFPGHESAKFTDSSLGCIPKGWEVKPLFDVATVKYGKMLPKKDLADDGPFPVYGAAKVIGRHTLFTREDRTIICGCRGSVGEMQITEPWCYVTNNSFTFDPVSANLYFWLFYTLSERGLRDVTGGAAQPQITLDGISQVFLSVPPDSILGMFEKRSRALAELAWNLKSKNQTLRRTRDLLLPMLLSGDYHFMELESVGSPT
jgi:type I restriction enzyme S subunit